VYRGRFLIHVNAVGRFGTLRVEGSKSEIKTHFQGGYTVVEYWLWIALHSKDVESFTSQGFLINIDI
jgi:hypothetical protein